ncbi:hypothetical protein V500_02184 [Pseudogymnoascus sp. VKM F-4518 (FW-2643)]|nr:hypothetical protein V500_02184 [Pseudogymnoascus sp. VKM F-4518 (FW-2643)]
MQARQERPFIQLPPLPNTEPDKCIHTTIRYYHYEPSKANSSSHHLNPKLRYLNPRYTVPGRYMNWTGAEDSLLLEQIPHTEPHGLRDRKPENFWHEVAWRMTQISRRRNISNREYTRNNCRRRYDAISKRIEDGINGNRWEDGHRGVNPYGNLIPSGYPLRMVPYIGLDRQLAHSNNYPRRQANLLRKTVNVQRIRSVIGVGKWVTPGRGTGHANHSFDSQ